MKPYRNNRRDIFMFLANRQSQYFTVSQISKALDIPKHSTWSALKTLQKQSLVLVDKSARVARYAIASAIVWGVYK